LTETVEDKNDRESLRNEQVKNANLAKLKIHFNKDPIYDYTEEEKGELFKCREHYQTHPTSLPVFLKSVRWDRPI
jgi:hypothetical protein